MRQWSSDPEERVPDRKTDHSPGHLESRFWIVRKNSMNNSIRKRNWGEVVVLQVSPHRIITLLELEGTPKCHLAPAMNMDTSLSNLFQCLTILIVKNFFLISSFKLKIIPSQSASNWEKIRMEIWHRQYKKITVCNQSAYSEPSLVKSIPNQSPTHGPATSSSLLSLPSFSEHHPSNQHNANSAPKMGSRHLSPKSSRKIPWGEAGIGKSHAEIHHSKGDQLIEQLSCS